MPLLPLPRLWRVPAALLVPARGLLEARVPWVRDQSLYHVVEREGHLVPFLLTKDVLLAATPPPHAMPLHSLPSTIPFPYRTLRFLREYPSAFALSPDPIEVSLTLRLSALHAAEAQALDATLPDTQWRTQELAKTRATFWRPKS